MFGQNPVFCLFSVRKCAAIPYNNINVTAFQGLLGYSLDPLPLLTSNIEESADRPPGSAATDGYERSLRESDDVTRRLPRIILSLETTPPRISRPVKMRPASPSPTSCIKRIRTSTTTTRVFLRLLRNREDGERFCGAH